MYVKALINNNIAYMSQKIESNAMHFYMQLHVWVFNINRVE